MYLKMNTEIKNKKWDVGDYVILNKETKLLKTSGTRSYSSFIGSHYVCIRETSEWQRGILIKGLGKVRGENLWIINGKPYCKDLREEYFTGTHYYSYPFPTVDELKTILDIVRFNNDIQQILIDNGMFFNPNGTFWVTNTKTQLLGLKHTLQYYDALTGRLAAIKSPDERHQRFSIAYF